MDAGTVLLFTVITALPPRFAFDEATLLAAIQDIGAREGERRGPFAAATAAQLRAAIMEAAAEGLVREVEIRPGEFLIVRTGTATRDTRELPREIAGMLDGWRPAIAQPPDELLGRALDVPVDTVALRRAILDPAQFVWTREDYAALLDAAGEGPRQRR